MIVRAEYITKNYKEVTAVNNISFSVDKGEIFGFIGPDGSGKTTLFRILTSLILPDEGLAWIDGLDVVKDFRKVRSIIGYMPGQFSLYTDLSVEENLNFFATIFGTNIESQYHLIRDIYIQIEPFKKRFTGRLSGGMKQKLALSCALIHEPKVLILDEPTTGVDAVSRREFWDLLKGLKAKGITILVSTPYMDEAILCDRIALIQKGIILSLDTPERIVHSFGSEVLSVRSDDLYRLLNDLRQYPYVASVFPFGQDLHYTDRRGTANQAELKKYLHKLEHHNIHIETITSGIEDVFMKLMDEKEHPNAV